MPKYLKIISAVFSTFVVSVLAVLYIGYMLTGSFTRFVIMVAILITLCAMPAIISENKN